MSKRPQRLAAEVVSEGWTALLERSRVYSLLNALNFLLALLAFLAGFLPTAALLGLGGALVSVGRISADVARNSHRDPIDVVSEHGGGPVGRAFVGGAALGLLVVRPGTLGVALAVLGLSGVLTALVLVAGVPTAVHRLAGR